MRIFPTLLSALALAGCQQMPELPAIISPYKIDIQQGNFVTQEMVAKLKAGMTRAQVRFALGSPLIVDPFRTDRWDYVYTYQKQGRETARRHITVIFAEDKLVRIEGDVVPADAAREAQKPAAKPPVTAMPAAKPAAAADKPVAAKPDAAQPDEKKDPPNEKGFFGRMLDKLGF